MDLSCSYFYSYDPVHPSTSNFYRFKLALGVALFVIILETTGFTFCEVYTLRAYGISVDFITGIDRSYLELALIACIFCSFYPSA